METKREFTRRQGMCMRSVLNYAIKDAENFKDPSLSWDFIECIIRTESITYSIKKSLSKRKNLLTLNKRLEILEETICQTPTAIGSIIRSRCKLLEEFERTTKIFF